MKYLVYAAVAALILWAVWYLARCFRRWRRRQGGCGCGCGGCPNTGCERREDGPQTK